MMKLGVYLALLLHTAQAFPTLLECARALEAGVTIMNAPAENTNDQSVVFARDGETLECGSTYVPGEVLTVVLSSSAGRQMFEATGGVLSTDGCQAYDGSSSDGSEEATFCSSRGFTRCPKQGSDTQEITAPTDGSDMTVKVGFASGFGTVSITQTCTLTAGGDVVTPTVAPTVALGTIVDIAVATDFLSILVTALGEASLVETLSEDGPFTVFAPTNDAFDALPEGVLVGLLNDIPALTNVLLYHVVSGTVLSTDLMDGMVVETLLDNATFTIDLSSGVTVVFETGNATVTSADIMASNGVIHIVDTVLIPPAAEVMPSAAPTIALGTIVDIAVATDFLSTLVSALVAADLVETLSGDGPFTVFAPTDDAFDALPEGTLDSLLDDIPALTDILLYHVVSGTVLSTDLMDGMVVETMLEDATFTIDLSSGVTVVFETGNATVISADIMASNGVVHVVDTVLIPPADTDVTPTYVPTMIGSTIVDIAVATDFLSTLVDALVAADLVETLSGDGPFTVFAPTNDAFDALPEGTLDSLLDDIPALTDILLYHVVSGTVLSTDLMDGMVVETMLEDATFTIDLSSGVTVVFETGNATVTSADIGASNGVIHIIDTVLIPPAGEPTDCVDSMSWYKRGDPSKDCTWVSEFTVRCGVRGFDSTLASYACPAACGTSCEDSTSWYKTGEPSKDCGWVSTHAPRCGVRGFDGTIAADECPTACA